ncbi:HNH endonuclease [Bacillus pseudomycoides]|uniref:HNH endonuclease n=1 Tax=Bacillus pseudomycoides TaxID=64104 RepID=UPI000BEE3192|nr:HNH endonuclease signature motif containing protein [Bacillus pseudomycoides]PED05269.1 endonuclease [Bacillus pseudomycoides]PEK14718.1 endonuclease [Bacillus pseudomycoides]PEO23181.1 endonuclease [Bacillus pseudomycoides]PEP58502.1 endonuclease [Bacillus pseudomycoides]PFW69770.1 endonuclease [Bacillus pseudomycoides]
MKYCAEQGCKTLIDKGRYCPNHKRKRKKIVVYSKNKSFYRTKAWEDLKAFCYQRDKGLCQQCGRFVFGKQAHHHHIVPIKVNPSLKLDLDNIMTLCAKCHPIVEKETNAKYQEKKKFDWKL